ncbi:MAG: oligoendopeptidase F [Pirellulaceae bacterium]
MAKAKQLPVRAQVDPADTWDLTTLYASDEAWEEAFDKIEKLLKKFAKFKGTLAESPQALAKCLDFDADVDRQFDRLGNYAYLKTTEDQGNSQYQRMVGRYQNLATRAAEASSFIRPEVLAIPAKTMTEFLASKRLASHKLSLERLLRYKPHTLGDREEQLLAMQGEMAGVASRTFRQLLDVDLKFESIDNEKGKSVEVTNANFTKLLRSEDRRVRKDAFHAYYRSFEGHQHTLAATLQGSIQKDVYQARVRNYSSALDQALFGDDVPRAVYENLISTVRSHLPTVHRYYELRRKILKLRDLHHYDCYCPLLTKVRTRYNWNSAVDVILAALAPLGDEYLSVLEKGLRGRWCDRYPNQGKQSGAFSYGTYDGDPYILMNFHNDQLNDVFTLAHEAGHSMHSYLSSKHQPYLYHSYTIFVAEVASTFNERLLNSHLQTQAKDGKLQALLISNEIDDIRATLVRQTMFAEFEKITHEMVEQGEPATVEALRKVYRDLLHDYFGERFEVDDQLSLECLRIPHFYRAFYVYKYATGLSAAIALSERVMNGGKQELKDYLGFLSGGCSKLPLELLRDAGVDMTEPQPIDAAMRRLATQVDALETLVAEGVFSS